VPGTRHFSRMNYNVQRGLRELLNERYISTAEWKAVLTHFDNRCAFCGVKHTGNNRTGLVPDHLIAAAQFGTLSLGNTIPACQDCNDHRGDAPWETYLRGRFAKEAKDRIARIKKHLGLHRYKPVSDPASILEPKELREYRSVLEAWNQIWKRACALRDAIKLRRLSATRGRIRQGGNREGTSTRKTD
jgi:hypothetical protein